MAGCSEVRRHLFEASFPCPSPLVGPAPFGSAVARAEEYLPGGECLSGDAATPELFAGLLARLVALAPSPAAVPSLEPAPPWVGWAHGGAGTWPRPDDLDVDLNRRAGPDWIDSAGRRLRERLVASHAPLIVGQIDWESHNIR
jgi:hypothetical protein